MKLVVGMPERDAEVSVLRRHAQGFSPRELTGVEAVIGADEIRAAQRAAARVEVTDDVLGYVVDLARATRHSPPSSSGPAPRLDGTARRGQGLGLAQRLHRRDAGPRADDARPGLAASSPAPS